MSWTLVQTVGRAVPLHRALARLCQPQRLRRRVQRQAGPDAHRTRRAGAIVVPDRGRIVLTGNPGDQQRRHHLRHRRDTDVDRILGLEIAGDHYVTKPINLRDLLARARSVLRRRSIDRKAARNQNSIAFGDWIIDLTRRELLGRDGKPVALTRAEFDLLAALVGADGRPLSRDYLIEVVSNRQTEVDIRTVDALVARLRRKLVGSGTPVIATVTGVGYKLALSERL